jgi:hypothetical protein
MAWEVLSEVILSSFQLVGLGLNFNPTHILLDNSARGLF